MRYLLSLIFILASSCTSVSRQIASDFDIPLFIYHKECPSTFDLSSQCLVLSTNVELSKRSEYLGSFDFPLPKIESPYYEQIPYFIKLASNKVDCEYSDSVTKVKEGYFKIKSNVEKEFLRCRSKSSDAEIGFSYILPVMSPFPVREAEWMRGFFPDVVSQTELKLSQIYNKWFEAKMRLGSDFTVSDGITYRGRELLVKYFNDTSYQVISPRKFGYQFEKTLNEGDLLIIKDVDGYVFHSRLGSTDHGGFSTETFVEEGRAGRRYLETTRIKPFEFFCQHNSKVYDFRLKSDLLFDSPGTVKCGINAKKSFFIPLVKPKGQTEFYVQHMNVEKSIELIPSHIENAKTKIKNKIKKMNEENQYHFRAWIYRAIAKKEKEIEFELEVDSLFAPSIRVGDKELPRQKLEVCGMLKKSSRFWRGQCFG